MNIEGAGHVAPPRKRVIIPRADHRTIMDIAVRRASYRRYGNRGDAWGRGLIGNAVDPIYIGSLSEYAAYLALSRSLGRDVAFDMDNKPRGDGGVDLVACGFPLQVKCRSLHSSTSRDRVTLLRVKSGGRLIRMGCAYLLCCEQAGPLSVDILGHTTQARVARLPVVPARKGNHQNIEIPDVMLDPFDDLVMLLKSLRECA